MPLLFVGVVGAAVIGYYFLAQKGGAQQYQTTADTIPGVIQARTNGPVPGTIPPGVQTPGMGASGQGPNTSGAVIGSATGAGLGLASYAALPGAMTALGVATIGIGAVVGIGLALWMAHLARVKGAKDENAVLNTLVPGFTEAMIKEFQDLNSGRISPTTALSDLEQIRITYWGAIGPYQKGPGQHTHPCAPLSTFADPRGTFTSGCSPIASAGKNTTPCDKTCTAGCCIGCDAIEPTICSAKTIIMMGGGSFKVAPIGGSKFGYAGQPGYTLAWRAQ